MRTLRPRSTAVGLGPRTATSVRQQYEKLFHESEPVDCPNRHEYQPRSENCQLDRMCRPVRNQLPDRLRIEVGFFGQRRTRRQCAALFQQGGQMFAKAAFQHGNSLLSWPSFYEASGPRRK